MAARTFLDTNVLVYAIESKGPDARKYAIAQACIQHPGVCISTQVLGEFYAATTSQRRASPLSHSEATAWVQLWKRFDLEGITVDHVNFALEFAGRHGVAYYVALILAAAKIASCELVLSEDLNEGQDYSGVRVNNPFAGRSPVP